MSVKELYTTWCQKAVDDPDLLPELLEVENNEEEIRDRFYRDLEFGTGGLRGVLGAGTNRMNVYTVRRATQGLANYVKASFDQPSVAISYDSRIKSIKFAEAAASVLAANGIKVHIYRELMPTPCLSWAVRALKCSAGIMVTASHNPSKYNGYKAYGADGCQITLEVAEQVINEINSLDMFNDVKYCDFDQAVADGMVSYIDQNIIEEYYTNVLAQRIHTDLCAQSGLKIVYTPLNGTGNKPVREILSRIGIKDVTVVKEQENPDGHFPTCPYPNPEIREALELGLKYCDEVKPDLLLATDPDADRVGIAVPDGDDYALFSGNEVGAMLLEYICSQRKANGTLPENPICVKTIVTTDLVKAIAKEYGVEVIEVLTGFKFIGEQIGLLEEKGQENRYVFGYEESYGYLVGTHARDKDAVVGSMIICEMTAYYKSLGINLIDQLENIYKKYGYFLALQKSFVSEGQAGLKKIADTMVRIRQNPPKTFAGVPVSVFKDIESGKSLNIKTGKTEDINLPRSNVLVFYLENGSSAIIRPSGTEPKIKIYVNAVGKTKKEAEERREEITKEGEELLGF